jgi:ABC-2 type transport system permease protein
MRLTRYGRLAAIFTGASLSVQLEYRANFVTSLVSALLTAGGAIFGLLVLTGDRQSIGGWSFHEATVVVGLFTLVQGFIGGVLYPNLNKIAEAVRTGTMDFTLLKPIDTQFLVSSRNVNMFPLINIGIGIAVIGWAIGSIPGASTLGVVLGAVLVAAALTIVYSVWFLLTTTAFWFVKVENITELFNGVFRAGQFPVAVFPGWMRFLFTFIVPIAFITTVPAEAITGRISGGSVIGAVVAAAALFTFSRWMWSRAVGAYTSASS